MNGYKQGDKVVLNDVGRDYLRAAEGFHGVLTVSTVDPDDDDLKYQVSRNGESPSYQDFRWVRESHIELAAPSIPAASAMLQNLAFLDEMLRKRNLTGDSIMAHQMWQSAASMALEWIANETTGDAADVAAAALRIGKGK